MDKTIKYIYIHTHMYIHSIDLLLTLERNHKMRPILSQYQQEIARKL